MMACAGSFSSNPTDFTLSLISTLFSVHSTPRTAGSSSVASSGVSG
jgi:hypothetical protein